MWPSLKRSTTHNPVPHLIPEPSSARHILKSGLGPAVLGPTGTVMVMVIFSGLSLS